MTKKRKNSLRSPLKGTGTKDQPISLLDDDIEEAEEVVFNSRSNKENIPLNNNKNTKKKVEKNKNKNKEESPRNERSFELDVAGWEFYEDALNSVQEKQGKNGNADKKMNKNNDKNDNDNYETALTLEFDRMLSLVADHPLRDKGNAIYNPSTRRKLDGRIIIRVLYNNSFITYPTFFYLTAEYWSRFPHGESLLLNWIQGTIFFPNSNKNNYNLNDWIITNYNPILLLLSPYRPSKSVGIPSEGNVNTVRFGELLGDMDEIKSVLCSTFSLDLKWLLKQLPKEVPLTVISHWDRQSEKVWIDQ